MSSIHCTKFVIRFCVYSTFCNNTYRATEVVHKRTRIGSVRFVHVRQMIGEMVFPLESSAAHGAGELRLRSAFVSQMLVQRIASDVSLAAIAAVVGLRDVQLLSRPT